MTDTDEKSRLTAAIQSRLESTVDILGEFADAPICIATEKQHDTGELIVRASRNTENNPFSVGDVIPTTEDLFCHRAANSRQFLHIDESRELGKEAHYLGLPIFDEDQEVFGVVCVKEASLPGGFEDTKKTLQKFVKIIEDDLKI